MEEMKEYSIVEAISLFTHKWKGVMLLVGIIYWACAWHWIYQFMYIILFTPPVNPEMLFPFDR